MKTLLGTNIHTVHVTQSLTDLSPSTRTWASQMGTLSFKAVRPPRVRIVNARCFGLYSPILFSIIHNKLSLKWSNIVSILCNLIKYESMDYDTGDTSYVLCAGTELAITQTLSVIYTVTPNDSSYPFFIAGQKTYGRSTVCQALRIQRWRQTCSLRPHGAWLYREDTLLRLWRVLSSTWYKRKI